MTYYIFAINEKLSGAGQCKCVGEDFINIEVDEELYTDYIATPNKYILGEKEITIDVPEYDEYGNPIMIIIEEEIQVPIYDEETGEIIGYETKIIEKEVQKTHKETVIRPYPVLNPNYEKEEEEKQIQHIKSLTCTKRVFALMLKEFGVAYSQLKELIASNEDAQLEWELASTLLRSNPLIDVFGEKLGISSKQIDILFQVANGELSKDDFELYKQVKEDIQEV